MIKQNELRVGNRVSDEWGYKIEVDSINEKGIDLYVVSDGHWGEIASYWAEPNYSFSELRGIPLTEEVLLKCGFDEIKVLGDGSDFSIELGQNVMLVVSNVGSVTCCACMCKVSQHENSLCCVSNSVFDFPYTGERLSLHQLQNLYFALTGKELEIKW